jgi:hypothetical protein
MRASPVDKYSIICKTITHYGITEELGDCGRIAGSEAWQVKVAHPSYL